MKVVTSKTNKEVPKKSLPLKFSTTIEIKEDLSKKTSKDNSPIDSLKKKFHSIMSSFSRSKQDPTKEPEKPTIMISSSKDSSKVQLKSNKRNDVSFFSNVNSYSQNQEELYLTIDDLDQKSITSFKQASSLVSSLLVFNIAFILLAFTFERTNLMKESLSCRASQITITYLMFFGSVVYLSVTIRNLKVFSSPKDFQNLYLVGSRRQVLGIYQAMIALIFLEMQIGKETCQRISFSINTLGMFTLICQTCVLLINLKICNDVKKACELSVAMESDESETNSKDPKVRYAQKEKMEGNFCIYENNTRARRNRRNNKRRRRGQDRGNQRTRQAGNIRKNTTTTLMGQEARLASNKSKSNSNLNNQNFSNENYMESNLEKARRAFQRKPNSKKEVRGIRISFQPKTHSIDSISTQASEERDSSSSMKINTSNELNICNQSSNQFGDLTVQKKTNFDEEVKNEFNDCFSNESDSIADIDEFQLEIDLDFDCKEISNNGLSFYKTPTKRLDKQFRKMCLSANKDLYS